MQPGDAATFDRFRNPLDPSVRYARGRILADATDEYRRFLHGQTLIQQRIEKHGPDSIYLVTGNQRDFPILASDLGALTEEWVGPALIASQLGDLVRGHLGAAPGAGVALFNRGSAGIIATISALAAEGTTVLSFAPRGSGAHASVRRGCYLARARLLETCDLPALESAVAAENPALVVITPVCSELNVLETRDVVAAVEVSRRAGIPSFVDDAYGARIRPVALGGPKSLELGADVAISNSDKAGLEGPRGGYMAGRADLVTRIQARAAELGQEARAPIAVGIMRALERFTPAHLLGEIETGKRLAEEVECRFGANRVVRTVMGPTISEEDILEVAMERADLPPERSGIVPAEATAALGMLLLEEHGILSVNVTGQPGARVSLRLKPIVDAVSRFGGAARMAEAVDRCVSLLAGIVADDARMAETILGRE
jgi:L-seryl-tRNA(Ser) seleniumtransferase